MISKCSDEKQTLRCADQRNASQRAEQGKRGREGMKNRKYQKWRQRETNQKMQHHRAGKFMELKMKI